jgi:hypothetical protein
LSLIVLNAVTLLCLRNSGHGRSSGVSWTGGGLTRNGMSEDYRIGASAAYDGKHEKQPEHFHSCTSSSQNAGCATVNAYFFSRSAFSLRSALRSTCSLSLDSITVAPACSNLRRASVDGDDGCSSKIFLVASVVSRIIATREIMSRR